MNHSPCDLCGSRSARELYTARDRLGNSTFFIAQCQCGVLRTLPQMTEQELAAFYPADYWGEEEPSMDWIKSSQKEKTRFFDRCRLAGGRILDVGCGAGFFLRALDQSLWNCYGVEISRDAASLARRALGYDRVFAGALKEAAFENSFFDAVSFWSALEHTNEPRATLTETRRIMKTGGTLIVQVPNAASYQARWFRGDWFALDAPRHRYHFTHKTLDHLLRETGFEIYRATFFSRAHNPHALRQSLKARLRAERPDSLGRAMFILTIPFLKPFDSLMSAARRGATLTLAARAV
ncbi:MAG: class I SAM-dependent methyltransferase [Acidobacteriota bacterium]